MDESCVINVEILQKEKSLAEAETLKEKSLKWLSSDKSLENNIFQRLSEGDFSVEGNELDPGLETDILSISLSVRESGHRTYPGDRREAEGDVSTSFSEDEESRVKRLSKAHLNVYVFRLNHEPISDGERIDVEEDLPSSTHLFLPSVHLHGLWESLVFETNIKDDLLNFVMTSLKFADNNVNDKIISWNKVVLLHGPPGTGKTSLCKALAHKLSIRLRSKFSCCQLIEINSHSLFSKWFSESGKLVMKLFSKIREFVEIQDNLVFVLIDEIESLAHTRQMSSNGNDPSDAIRVVNALLTQIDIIKNYRNVVILTTSNVTGAIDLAFVDRADIKQFIGMPSQAGVYEIYKSCINELVNAQVVQFSESILSMSQLRFAESLAETFSGSLKLLEISRKSVGFSGRTLRKVPFLAVAMYSGSVFPLRLDHFLEALDKAVERQRQERDALSSN